MKPNYHSPLLPLSGGQCWIKTEHWARSPYQAPAGLLQLGCHRQTVIMENPCLMENQKKEYEKSHLRFCLTIRVVELDSLSGLIPFCTVFYCINYLFVDEHWKLDPASSVCFWGSVCAWVIVVLTVKVYFRFLFQSSLVIYIIMVCKEQR